MLVQVCVCLFVSGWNAYVLFTLLMLEIEMGHKHNPFVETEAACAN